MKVGDKESAAVSLRSTVGNTDNLVQATEETKQISTGLNHLPEPVYDIPNANLDLDNIPNSMLGEFIQPKVFNQLHNFMKDFSDFVDQMDFSYISTADSHSHFSRKQPAAKDEPFQFGFGSNSYQFDQSSFMFNSDSFGNFDFGGLGARNAQDIHKKMKSAIKGFSMPKLSNFVSVHDHAAVMEKHQARETALGDVCIPLCQVNDAQCNCNKLFDCVQNMTEYDLAVLTAGGYIDNTSGSSTYGEFRIQVNKLVSSFFQNFAFTLITYSTCLTALLYIQNLFNFERIGEKLQQVKSLVNISSSSDSTQCTNILKQFYSACDPTKQSCSIANPQTFQVTVDQVCDAVNTRTKLKFEAIGDEFDNFVDKIGTRK